VYLRGWFGFFQICSAVEDYSMRGLDARIRRRLRAIQLNHWKTKRTIARKLIALGVRRQTVWRRVYAGRKGPWALSHDYVADRGIPIAYFAKRGLISLRERLSQKHKPIIAPRQPMLDFAGQMHQITRLS
jgi:RNA-directed DNA polymerase